MMSDQASTAANQSLAEGIQPQTQRVMNLAHFLTQSATRLSNELGLIWGERRWTWAEMEARVHAMALALRHQHGVQKGDRVLLQSSNNHQLFESMFACFRLGAVWVPTNFRQSPDEVAYLASSSGAKVMISEPAFASHVEAAQSASTALQTVIWIKNDIDNDNIACVSNESESHTENQTDSTSYDELIEQYLGQTCPAEPVERDHPCWFFYTSGTTGRPKAGVLTHGQMAFVVTNHLSDLMPGMTQQDASIVVAPLSHGAGVHQLVQVARGVKTILPAAKHFDPDEIWRLVEVWQVSNLFTVPTIVKKLVESPSVDQYDHSSLRYVIYAGAPMYRADQKRALVKLGKVLVQYFGLGEVTGNITVLPPHEHFLEDDDAARIGTCGYARTGIQVEIQNASGEPLPAYETGEICVIGPAVFAGYFNHPKANAKAFRNGWFLTGDLGHKDAEGFVYITGRASDMYISGGSNIYPREIEEKLLLHADVNEVAVLGVEDATWGEVGLAVCVLRESQQLPIEPTARAEALKTWLQNTQMSRYKIPKHFVFWQALPKSAYGKITKKLIKAQLIERNEMPQRDTQTG